MYIATSNISFTTSISIGKFEEICNRVVKLVQGESARKYEYKKKKESSTERKDERINM